MDNIFKISEDGKTLLGILDKTIKHCAIPDGVTRIGGRYASFRFSGCTSLECIDLPNSVTEIGMWAFSGCTSLESIDLPGSVTKIGSEAFKGCTSLKRIDLPDSVTEIGDSAFVDCTSLERIDLPDSVTKIGWRAFEETKWLANQPQGPVYINNMLYSYKGDVEDGHFAVREGTKLIVGGAFEGCTSLKSIDLPNSVTEIGLWAFEGLYLETSKLP